MFYSVLLKKTLVLLAAFNIINNFKVVSVFLSCVRFFLSADQNFVIYIPVGGYYWLWRSLWTDHLCNYIVKDWGRCKQVLQDDSRVEYDPYLACRACALSSDPHLSKCVSRDLELVERIYKKSISSKKLSRGDGRAWSFNRKGISNEIYDSLYIGVCRGNG